MRLSSSSALSSLILSAMAFSVFSWLATITTAFTCCFCQRLILKTKQERCWNFFIEEKTVSFICRMGWTKERKKESACSYPEFLFFDRRQSRCLSQSLGVAHTPYVHAHALYASSDFALAHRSLLLPSSSFFYTALPPLLILIYKRSAPLSLSLLSLSLSLLLLFFFFSSSFFLVTDAWTSEEPTA